MSDELQNALIIVRKACASVVADLDNHQIIQSALAEIEAALTLKSNNVVKDKPLVNK